MNTFMGVLCIIALVIILIGWVLFRSNDNDTHAMFHKEKNTFNYRYKKMFCYNLETTSLQNVIFTAGAMKKIDLNLKEMEDQIKEIGIFHMFDDDHTRSLMRAAVMYCRTHRLVQDNEMEDLKSIYKRNLVTVTLKETIDYFSDVFVAAAIIAHKDNGSEEFDDVMNDVLLALLDKITKREMLAYTIFDGTNYTLDSNSLEIMEYLKNNWDEDFAY